MVGQQGPGLDGGLDLARQSPQARDNLAPVCFLGDHGPPLNASYDDMVQRPWSVSSSLAWHLVLSSQPSR
jgi:hypothetical protein